DDRWAGRYPDMIAEPITMDRVAVRGTGTDVAIVTYGNGVFLAEQAAEVLRTEHGIAGRVVDMRWLAPLPVDAIEASVESCAQVLIVDECRETGSQSEALMAHCVERNIPNVSRLCATDSFIATGPASGVTLPSCDSIVEAVRTGRTEPA
ncbi:MAG: 2-oxoisovalerate dehydrogenase E1 component, partial [Ilumatobacter sp.]